MCINVLIYRQLGCKNNEFFDKERYNQLIAPLRLHIGVVKLGRKEEYIRPAIMVYFSYLNG